MNLPGDQTLEIAAEQAFVKVQLARHPARPYSLDYVEHLFESFYEIKGDRRFSDDRALITGFGVFRGEEIAFIGQQKGRNTKERRQHNFGMPKPEGYRKAARLMHLAEKFNRPIICFIDTPGAFPGVDAEERGQAEAIAFNLSVMARLNVPVIVIVIGEGGSGGALAIGVGDYVLMLENTIYSVISPEGCAAILWKDAAKSNLAAAALKLTAAHLKELGLIDELICEPIEGAHNSLQETVKELDLNLQRFLPLAKAMNPQERVKRRYARLRAYGL